MTVLSERYQKQQNSSSYKIFHPQQANSPIFTKLSVLTWPENRQWSQGYIFFDTREKTSGFYTQGKTVWSLTL